MRLDNFIKRPVLSTVISILTVILGLIGLVSLPMEQYPDVAPPTVSVSANYQGANAQTVLNSVIVPLERAADFYDLVGKNTGYVINPEECLADNFSYAVCGTEKQLPNPEITERIIAVIKTLADGRAK